MLLPNCQLRLFGVSLGCPADPTRRFLAARKYDPGEATKHFETAHRFREDNHIIRLYDMIDIAEFERTRKLVSGSLCKGNAEILIDKKYFHWTGRRDKNGRPVCFFDLDYMDKDSMAHWDQTRTVAPWKYSQDETKPPNPDMRQLASVYIDSLLRFITPLCSMMADRPEPSKPITSGVYLVDATNFGLKQAWSIRTFAHEISLLLNTCYPETVEKIYVGTLLRVKHEISTDHLIGV